MDGLKAVAVFVVMVMVLIVAPLALVAWNSVAAQQPEAATSAPADEVISPVDDDNTVIWRKQCSGGDVRSRYQPALDRYKVICYGPGSMVEWVKDCELASAGRFAYSRFVPGLPGTRAVCLAPLP